MSDFKATLLKDTYDNAVECTPLKQLKVATNYRLAGGVFNDSILDPNFYTATVAANGTATVADGVLTCAVTADSGSTSCVASVRPGRYLGSNSNYYRGNVHLDVLNATNNTRRWGAFNGTNAPTNGAYFKFSGGVLSVCHKTASGSEVAVASGSFNGRVASYAMDLNCHTYEVYYTVRRILFVVDSVLLHTFVATTSPLVGEMHLRANLMNVNTGVGSACGLYSMTMAVGRWGEAKSAPRLGHISGAATTLLKTGPGSLHGITVNTPKGTATIYDSTTGSGTVIGVIDMSSVAGPYNLTYGGDFTNGLTIVTTSTPDLTVAYE